ncbi:MAG: 8-oxo-dGTP diphosphatase [Halobacteriales archaeon]
MPADDIQEATLCFPVDPAAGEVLLIRKKRGVGAGYYNGPGGKLEAGETPREAVKREVNEEVKLAVHEVDKYGELRFVFGEEPFMFVHVYRTDSFTGPARETPEADPTWFAIESIPYDEMWEDDRYWLPLLFDGEQFKGTFRFDAEGEELLDHDLTTDVSF